jgi:hypothetical protein
VHPYFNSTESGMQNERDHKWGVEFEDGHLIVSNKQYGRESERSST